jgi:mono/diheme cytochrome c family protein
MKWIRFRRLAAVLFVAAARPAWPAEPITAFLERHCLRCHGEKSQEGDLRLDTLPRDFSDIQTAERWAEVMGRVNSGEMPPEEEPRPTIAEIESAVGWISGQIREAQAARMASRGAVSHYRLSREEYANTVYDLLGVRFDVTVPGTLHEDPRWHGFERIGSVLSLSPSQVVRYFKAGEVVLARAFPQTVAPSTIVRTPAHEGAVFEEPGLAERMRRVVGPGFECNGKNPRWNGTPRGAPGGFYRCRVQLSGLPSPKGIAPHLSVWDPQLKKSIFDVDVVAPENKPVIIEFEAFLPDMGQLKFVNEVAFPFPKGTANYVTPLIPNSKELHRLNRNDYQLFDDEGRALFPLLLIDWVEWEGPITTEAELAMRKGLLPEFAADAQKPKDPNAKDPGGPREATSDEEQASRQALQAFADRAWRRPASGEEVERYVGVFRSECAAGKSRRQAHLAAMLGILTSKNFYYIVEGQAPEAAAPGTASRPRISDFELASRLSYFLWSSMPDEALLAAAKAGTLHEPEQLRAQVKRMLADPKTRRFTDSFPTQWLQLHRVGMFAPDRDLYPDYDLWLEKSMILETTGFFREVFEQDLSIRDFLDCDWTILNPRLARHYEMPALQTSGFQKVALRPEHHRGGLLTMGSVLSLSSDGTRHRPVHRGVWVSEAIFGKSPPPPPANVEPIEPVPSDQPKATIRMQLESHATNASCAACHQKIDPLGFAFENYDAIGRWRTEELVTSGQGENPPVNATGTMADGRSYDGPAEFRKLLTADMDAFAEAFVENLATYALRRTMSIDDREQLRAIAKRSAASDYRLRQLLENLMVSDLFQSR